MGLGLSRLIEQKAREEEAAKARIEHEKRYEALCKKVSLRMLEDQIVEDEKRRAEAAAKKAAEETPLDKYQREIREHNEKVYEHKRKKSLFYRLTH